MNLDDIKKRHDGNAYKPYFMDLFGENKEPFSTHNDIFYLLSIIEIATNFFEKVEEWESFSKEDVSEASSKYMKAIRGS